MSKSSKTLDCKFQFSTTTALSVYFDARTKNAIEMEQPLTSEIINNKDVEVNKNMLYSLLETIVVA